MYKRLNIHNSDSIFIGSDPALCGEPNRCCVSGQTQTLSDVSITDPLLMVLEWLLSCVSRVFLVLILILLHTLTRR